MERLAELSQGSTLARQIRDALMDRILSGELEPGSRLKDNEVAASFRASNTPAREALRLLAQDGLVEIVPYRGCVVHSVDAQELAEIFDVRAALEAHAARVVAAQASAEHLQDLAATVRAHEEACAAGDRERAFDADRRFHHLLTSAAGNRTLLSGLQHMENRVRLAFRAWARHEPVTGHASCRAILEALEARDGERAAALVAEHIALGKARVCEALEAGRTKEGAP